MPLAPSALPIANVATRATAPPITTRIGCLELRATADPRAHGAGGRQRHEHGHEGQRNPDVFRRQQDGQHGQDRTGEERDGGSERRVPRAHDVGLVNVEFGREVRAEGIVRREFLGHRPCGRGAEALALVDRRELLELFLRLFLQLPALLFDQGVLAVLLAADGDISPERHRDQRRPPRPRRPRAGLLRYRWSRRRRRRRSRRRRRCRRWPPGRPRGAN